MEWVAASKEISLVHIQHFVIFILMKCEKSTAPRYATHLL